MLRSIVKQCGNSWSQFWKTCKLNRCHSQLNRAKMINSTDR